MECTSDWNENVCIHREHNIQCVLWDRGTGLCTCKRATGTHVSMKGERSMVKCMRYITIMRGRERERARGTKSQNRLTTSYGTKLTNCTHFKKNKRSYQIYDVRRRNGIVALLVGRAPHTAVTTLLLL